MISMAQWLNGWKKVMAQLEDVQVGVLHASACLCAGLAKTAARTDGGSGP
jgi:hypothetical protein